MTDQSVDVGVSRPATVEWSSDHSSPAPWGPAVGLGRDLFGLPVDIPPTPVTTLATTVASAATIEARHVADGARSRWEGLSALAQRVARAARQHPADAWVVVECLAVTVTGLATMTLLGTDSPASWGALV